ncbi:hypothetical protein [Kordiimonas sp.]|uniref:hypothetical protein n=1 Tax=Kordiimonas sp. TaxID=1970157 RepID=UPI003B52F88A
MKLILRQYLATLRERKELDAILPDLLSQMGLNVFSKPSIGTRQFGVDIAAVGRINGGSETVYLFSVKAGNLDRTTWDGASDQSLRPSLNEIIDSYIPLILPPEHKDKPIAICVCLGGEIHEATRQQVSGFFRTNSTLQISFEEWNGDRLAALIQEHLLREDLMPSEARGLLRKSLALIDEPEVSHRHFGTLVRQLTSGLGTSKQELTASRQILLCLWTLFAWCRDAGNLEAAYLASELALLALWARTHECMGKRGKLNKARAAVFFSTLDAYRQITGAFIYEKIGPVASVEHGLSSATRSSNELSLNLKLFDVLGRIALCGIWNDWLRHVARIQGLEEQERECSLLFHQAREILAQAINNNPTLLQPTKDDHNTEISLAVMLLGRESGYSEYIKEWIKEITRRSIFSYETRGQFPCMYSTFSQLLELTDCKSDDVRKEATAGSVLYPTLALYATVWECADLYRDIRQFQNDHMEHCSFQLWMPNEQSEQPIWLNEVT